MKRNGLIGAGFFLTLGTLAALTMGQGTQPIGKASELAAWPQGRADAPFCVGVPPLACVLADGGGSGLWGALTAADFWVDAGAGSITPTMPAKVYGPDLITADGGFCFHDHTCQLTAASSPWAQSGDDIRNTNIGATQIENANLQVLGLDGGGAQFVPIFQVRGYNTYNAEAEFIDAQTGAGNTWIQGAQGSGGIGVNAKHAQGRGNIAGQISGAAQYLELNPGDGYPMIFYNRASGTGALTALLYVTNLGEIYPLSGIAPGISLPTCSGGIEGELTTKLGGGGVATKLCICTNSDGAGTYKWCSINDATGGSICTGSTTVCN